MAPEAELAALEARIAGAEFKRWQSPPVLKVSEVAFGRGRLVPFSHRLRRFSATPATGLVPGPTYACVARVG